MRAWRGSWATTALLFGLCCPSVLLGEDGDLLSRQEVPIQELSLPSSIPEAQARAIFKSLEALASKVRLEAITYESEGLKVKGYLATPRRAGTFPAVILNRGGKHDFGFLTPFSASQMLGNLAGDGYVVVASQYRGTDGGEGMEEYGGADVDDVLNLLPLLDSLPEVDASRIGMFGLSRGGMMTYLALARTDRVKAAVVGAGLADLADSIAERPDMESEVYSQLIPGWNENREAEIRARSAVHWADRLPAETPLLLLHGSADWRVSPKQSLDMARALLEAKRPFRLMIFEGGDHGLTEYREEVRGHVTRWFDHYVRDEGTWPSLEPHGR